MREMYTFVINNVDTLRRDTREAMAEEIAQAALPFNGISEKPFSFPQAIQFTYDAASKVQAESAKNVYQGYLLSAEPRSSSEKRFESYCEACPAVEWIYKNGDKGEEYLSIVYNDNSGAQRLFYPDYALSVNGKVWIIETKGGFDRTGESEDIDIFSAKKFAVLKAYTDKHKLKGGFVRCDKQSEELCIATKSYSDDIRSESWRLLSETFRI